MDFFESHGVPLKTERGNRVFPMSDRAEDIVATLQKCVRKAGIPVIRGRAKSLIIEDGCCVEIRLTDGGEV